MFSTIRPKQKTKPSLPDEFWFPKLFYDVWSGKESSTTAFLPDGDGSDGDDDDNGDGDADDDSGDSDNKVDERG